MKKINIFILAVMAFFLFPSVSFSAYPGECSFAQVSCRSTSISERWITPVTTVTFDKTGGTVAFSGGTYSTTYQTAYWCGAAVWYFENGSWIIKPNTSIIAKSATPTLANTNHTDYTGAHSIAPTITCADLPCDEGFEKINGECVPKCLETQVRNPVGDCVVCPSETFMLGGYCLPLCPYGQNYTPEGIYNNPVTGTCVGPPCGPDEILIEGKCKSQCTNGLQLDINTGSCSVICPEGTHNISPTQCQKDCKSWQSYDVSTDSCIDVEKPLEETPTPTPEETPTPPGETAPDTTPAPEPETADNNGEEWLKAIKKNSDKELGALANIDENVKRSVDNQVVIDGKLGAINSNLGKAVDILGDISNKTGDETEGPEIDTSLSGAPGQPEYNTDLDPEGNYNINEYSDPLEAAINRSAEEVLFMNGMIDNQQTPVQASITATGDACLNGTVTIHGNQKALSICFDKPWMLQGYALMKIVLVGCGYIQVIMMLNRALLGA